MSAASEAAAMLMSDRLGLRSVTIRRIVDRLPASLLQAIVVESFIRNRVDPIVGPDGYRGILPCPFCGGRADFTHAANSVMCDECGAVGGEHEEISIAAAMWNRRVPVRPAQAGGEGE